MDCIKVEVFTARCESNAISNLIILATTPLRFRLTGRSGDTPTHTGLRLTLDDGSVWAAHASFERDWTIQPWLEVASQYTAGHGWTRAYDLHLDHSERELVYAHCQNMRGRWVYTTKQLFLMLGNRLFHTSFHGSPRDVVCSEAGVRILKGILDKAILMACRKSKPDYVAPVDLVIALERLGYELTS